MSSYKEIDDYDENNIGIHDDDDFDILNMRSLIMHINSNKLGFFLLFLVFVIIYIIDYINGINSMIFGISNSGPIPGIQNTFTMQLPGKMIKKKPKKNKIL